MIHRLSTNIALTLSAGGIIESEDLEAYVYGVELFLTSTAISLSIAIIAILSKTVIASLIYALVFWIGRFVIGGYHCSTYSKCYLTSLFLYVFLPIAINWRAPLIIIVLIIFDVFLVLFCAFRYLPANKIGYWSVFGIIVTSSAISIGFGMQNIAIAFLYGYLVIELLYIKEHENEREKQGS